MGSVINGVGLAKATAGSSATDLATLAGEACLADAGIDRSNIELVIYTGVYRQDNVVEPAIASLFQRALRINGDPLTSVTGKTTFSFDILNGPCGIINSFQIIDSFFDTKAYSTALIISGDIHPSGEKHLEFPYSTVYTALLLQRIPDSYRGFKKFYFRTQESKDNCGLRGIGDFNYFLDVSRWNIKIQQDPLYLKELTCFTGETIRELIKEMNLNPEDIDHIIMSQPDRFFSQDVTQIAGIEESKVIRVFDDFGDPHSAGIPTGFMEGVHEKLFHKNDTLLFVAAGAGLTVACCLYKF